MCGAFLSRSGLQCRSNDTHIMHLESALVNLVSQCLQKRRKGDCVTVRSLPWSSIIIRQAIWVVMMTCAGDSKGHCSYIYDHVMLPLVLRRINDDKDRQERIIMNNIGCWIIVRPGFPNNGPRTGQYRALTDLQGIHGGRISRADVADFMLKQAKSPQFIGQTPMLIY